MKTKEELQAEYQQAVAKAGEIQYRILCYQGELAHWNQQILALNKEADKLNKGDSNGSTETIVHDAEEYCAQEDQASISASSN